MSEHKYKTEGSDYKHGALRMVAMCTCGWHGKVVEGQDNMSRLNCEQQWQEHMAQVAIEEEAREYEIAARAAQHCVERGVS